MRFLDLLRLSVAFTGDDADAVYKVRGNRDSRTQCTLLYAWLSERLAAYYFSHDVDHNNKPTHIFVIQRKEFEAYLKKFNWEKLN